MTPRLIPLALLVFTCATASAAPQNNNPIKKSGKYAVELRIPANGVFAQEETDIEFRVTDTSNDDPVLGAAPIVNAKVIGNVSMPAMPAMPAQTPKVHSEGVPGDYGVVAFFPHGGDYQLDLNVTPPGGSLFTVSFKVPVADAQPLKGRKPKPQPYVLEVTPNMQPDAKQPVELKIHVRRSDTKAVVNEFDTVHEQKMHFIVVSQDLQHFTHEHPDFAPDGTFALNYTFPTGGTYTLFADTAPKGAGGQVLSQTIEVRGSIPTSDALVPATKPGDVVDGVRIAMKTDASKLPSGRMIPLTFTVQDEKTSAPITDIQPWLGAISHLILIHQDATTFVHSHPDETDPSNGRNGLLTFNARFPKPGIYKGWIQFQRAGQVHTASFIVRAGASK